MPTTGSKLSLRWRQRRRRTAPKKDGAGRPTLFPGKVPVRHATGYFTAEGWDKLAEIRQLLAARGNATPGVEVSVSDALETAIHHLHDHLSRVEKIPA